MVVAYDDGHQVFVGMCGDEAAFSAPTLSPDGQTIAWTALTDDRSVSTLVLYRNGRILSRISADSAIADWGFYGRGQWIGIARKAAEPGKAGTCAMYDASTGDPAGTIDAQPAAAQPCALAFRSLGHRDAP